MPIEFVKNIQFTRLLKVNDRLREFNFRKAGNRTSEEFSVDTVDERGTRIMFAMKKEEDHWAVLTIAVPLWIKQSEAKLGELIDEEQNQFR